MSGGGFGAQTPAIASTASAFEAQSDPIQQEAERLESIKGSASTTGRAYAAQGDAYHQGVTGPLEKIIRSFGEKCIWVSTKLSDTQDAYDAADASGSSGLTASGSGVT
ncbi:MAG TPA: hypothetical protein VFE19_01580 [Jatrophihabitantaceae bacterium]|jgi:hypothetical protein|nr:hypothetical protein [Jatrophihabitantaceae bacterium]